MTDPAPAAPVLDVAGALLTSEVASCAPGDRAGDVRRAMVGRRFESLHAIAVLEGERLAGLLRAEDLLEAADDARVGDLMDPDPPRIAPGADQEEAAWRSVRHREGALAVVGDDGRFLGLIPPHRLLGVLLREHHEDMARLGGYMADSGRARSASEEAVPRRLWHRLPWLVLGLAGALVAAAIVGGFEEEIERSVLLALFLPGIVYMADAVGTQTETLVIRGLSVGVPIRRIALRELVTGVIAGVVLAAVFVPIGLLIWGEADVIAAVALALLAACSVATVVAMALPALFGALGVDPAFGSGPLATVIQDLLSIVIYFAVAIAVV